jgi:PKD repeat protein
MAAPGIAGSFTADVQNGDPPFDVQFTDTTEITDGFARYWLWEFGDGTISTDQNPVHTYDGEPGETYDVRLTVIATTLEFQSLSKQDKNAVWVSGTLLSGASSEGDFEAWLARASADPGSSIIASHLVVVIGGAYSYSTRSVTVLYETSFNNALHLLMVTDNPASNPSGVFISSPGGSLSPASTPSKQEVGRLSGLTTTTPLTAAISVEPTTALGSGPSNGSWGMTVNPSTRTYYSHGTQSFDFHEEESFITINKPPIASFTASPTAGVSLLNVQFNNTSEEAIGAPTFWSWKKRLSGSGDSFVEFSTDKHPSETFTK